VPINWIGLDGETRAHEALRRKLVGLCPNMLIYLRRQFPELDAGDYSSQEASGLACLVLLSIFDLENGPLARSNYGIAVDSLRDIYESYFGKTPAPMFRRVINVACELRILERHPVDAVSRGSSLAPAWVVRESVGGGKIGRGNLLGKKSKTGATGKTKRSGLHQPPLTELQREILKALDGKGLIGQELANLLQRHPSTIFRACSNLKELNKVKTMRGTGYYRPDRPPAAS